MNVAKNFATNIKNTPADQTSITMAYKHLINYPLSAEEFNLSTQKEILEQLEVNRRIIKTYMDDINYITSRSNEFLDVDSQSLVKSRNDLAKLHKIYIDFERRCLTSYTDCQLPQTDVAFPILPVRVNQSEAMNSSCLLREYAICGVEQFTLQRNSACGVATYKEGRDGSVCGWSLDATVGCMKLSTEESFVGGTCGREIKVPKTCRNPAFGVESYNSCEYENFGIALYNECRCDKNPVEKYKRCKDQSFGVLYQTCPAVSNGIEKYKSCMVSIDSNSASVRLCSKNKKKKDLL